MINGLVEINELDFRIEQLKNKLKKEVRVREDDTPGAMLEEIKKICNDCLIHHINRKGAECDTNYILWLASAIVYQKAKLEALPRGEVK